MATYEIPPEALLAIDRILHRGNTVELKKVNGKIEVIEITRQVKIKAAL